MISLEECKTYIGATSLNDTQIERFRDGLYAFAERAMDLQGVRDNVVNKELTCKTVKSKAFSQGPLSTAEFLLTGKRKKDTALRHKS